MTTLVLAVGFRQDGLAAMNYTREPQPYLLSYHYWKTQPRLRVVPRCRHWVLDSGAFTAHTQGTPISLDEYTADCLDLLQGDAPPAEIYGLDVIRDPEATMRNVEEMHARGVPALPTFHLGSPWHYLEDMAKRYDKIALGGMVRQAGLRGFAEQCFARVWPKKIHGFGVGRMELLNAVPFHSVDSSTWTLGPCGFGYWRAFGLSVREGPSPSNDGATRAEKLAIEADAYAKIERRLKARWARELAQL